MYQRLLVRPLDKGGTGDFPQTALQLESPCFPLVKGDEFDNIKSKV
jgi:hypothetical protein